MTRALRKMEASLSSVDFVVYIVDGRAPWSCQNPAFDNLFIGMPVLYVLNKYDLCDTEKCKQWLSDKNKPNIATYKSNSLKNNLLKDVSQLINQICKAKIDKYKNKGINISLKGIVVGVPNVGKSTFINSLARSKKTKVGDMPGVTRGQQTIKISEYLDLLDTPGTLYPKLNDQEVAINLALIGSIRDQVLDSVELSHCLIDRLQTINKNILQNLYEVTSDMDSAEILNKVAQMRAFLLKGGILDIDRASLALIDDFRKGKLGKITLDI